MSAARRGTLRTSGHASPPPPPSLSLSLSLSLCLSVCLSARIPARATVLAADLNDPFHNARLLQTYERPLVQTRRLRRGRSGNSGGGASGDFTRR